MIPLDLDAMEAAAQRLLTAHGLTADGTGDNDRIISPAITSARDVLALAAALRTERAAREAAEAQHAALAGAVRAEREATDALRFDAHHRSGFSRFDDGEEATEARATELRSATALDDARRATDALLAAAPAPTTVPAALVRAYLAAVEAFDGGALGAPCRASIRVDDTRAALVAALERCP